MNGVDILKTFLEAVETENFDQAKQHLSGNFVMTGWTTQPLNKYQFLNLMVALKKSMPELAFHIQNIQEDYQLAQSDHVEADMQVTGVQTSDMSTCPQESRMVSLPCGHVSFTIMGDTIESMIATPVPDSGIKEIVTQLREAGAIQGREVSLVTQNDSLHEQEQHSADGQARTYNKQSNLYDPQGKSYTPSHDEPDYAPQVDASAIAQSKLDNPAAPLFEVWQEQRELTSREPNRQNLKEKEND